MCCFQRFVSLVIFCAVLCFFVVGQAVAADSDYNYDGTSDILFQHSDDGRLLFWSMTNFNRSLNFPKSLAPAWDVVGKGDFNGDGTSDVLYMKDAGDTSIALINNSARSSLTFPGGINPIWSVKGVGDFDGDGTDDILWQRSTDGVTTIWGIKNAARNKISYPGALASFWRIAGIGDFNNDGIDDILCQHIDDGRLLIWQMNNLTRSSVKFAQSIANSWTVVGVGDFNKDGTDDVLYRKDAGDVAIAEMSNFNRSNLKFPGGIGTVWGVKDVGDYNGDGTDDILFRRSTDNVTVIWGIVNSVRNKVTWPGGLAAQWVVKSDFNDEIVSTSSLPDTGQATCYDASGTVIGCSGTGQDGEYQSTQMSYTDNDDGTVTDNVTGLVWQKDCDGILYTFDDAINYCENLSLAGYNDWYLPSRRELTRIVDEGQLTSKINAVFTGNPTGYYYSFWTSTIKSPSFPFCVSFTANGDQGSCYTGGVTAAVRCVR